VYTGCRRRSPRITLTERGEETSTIPYIPVCFINPKGLRLLEPEKYAYFYWPWNTGYANWIYVRYILCVITEDTSI
jgi:hypothetical protein